MAHDINPAGNAQRDRQLLLDQQDRHAGLGDLGNRVTDLLNDLGRQALGRLVDDDQFRVAPAK